MCYHVLCTKANCKGDKPLGKISHEAMFRWCFKNIKKTDFATGFKRMGTRKDHTGTKPFKVNALIPDLKTDTHYIECETITAEVKILKDKLERYKKYTNMPVKFVFPDIIRLLKKAGHEVVFVPIEELC